MMDEENKFYDNNNARNPGGADDMDYADDSMNSSSSRLDLLIERLVDDGAGSEHDWNEFRLLAAADHKPWQLLAEQQHIQKLLCAELNSKLAPAMSVELPGILTGKINSNNPDNENNQNYNNTNWIYRVNRYAGWAAAIVVALLWSASMFIPNPQQNNYNNIKADKTTDVTGMKINNNGTKVPAVNSSRVETTKPVLLGMTRNNDGTVDVTYGHWVIERNTVEQFYGRQWDETGRSVDQPDSSINEIPTKYW